MPCVIVVANRFDMHADAVVDEIRPFCTLIRVDPQMPLPPLTIDSAGNAAIDGVAFNVDEVTGVYCRFALEQNIHVRAQHAVEEFAAAEHYAALSGLLRCIDRQRWVNYCFDEVAVDGKISSLRAAAKHGLNVPPFIVSSSPELLKDFSSKHAQVIIKPISDASIALQKGDFVEIPDFHPFDAPYSVQYDATEPEDEVDGTPTLVQQKITKCADVRVVVVDDQIFATSIPHETDDPIDVRLLKHHPALPVTLSPALIASLVALLQESLRLRFCTIDLIQRHDGEYFAVDINPQGNWLAGNTTTETPIIKALATSLLSTRN